MFKWMGLRIVCLLSWFLGIACQLFCQSNFSTINTTCLFPSPCLYCMEAIIFLMMLMTQLLFVVTVHFHFWDSHAPFLFFLIPTRERATVLSFHFDDPISESYKRKLQRCPGEHLSQLAWYWSPPWAPFGPDCPVSSWDSYIHNFWEPLLKCSIGDPVEPFSLGPRLSSWQLVLIWHQALQNGPRCALDAWSAGDCAGIPLIYWVQCMEVALCQVATVTESLRCRHQRWLLTIIRMHRLGHLTPWSDSSCPRWRVVHLVHYSYLKQNHRKNAQTTHRWF